MVQFVTNQINVLWCCDLTDLEVGTNFRKVKVFVLIDLCFSEVLGFRVFENNFNSTDIAKTVESCIKKRKIQDFDDVSQRLIINSDRGEVFRSKPMENLGTLYRNKIYLSMSRQATPTDNAVVERYMRTFKHSPKITTRLNFNGLSLEKKLKEPSFNNISLKELRRILGVAFKTYNYEFKNSRTTISPAVDNQIFEKTKDFINMPPKELAYSKRFFDDPRRRLAEEVKETIKTVHGEIVQYIPQALLDDNVRPYVIEQLNNIENQIDRIELNQEITNDHLEDQMSFMKEQFKELLEIKDLVKAMYLGKNKQPKTRETLALRDPCPFTVFDVIIDSLPLKTNKNYIRLFYQAQICFAILYFTGLRVNEIRVFTLDQVEDLFITKRLSVTMPKQKDAKIISIPDEAEKIFQKIKEKIDFLRSSCKLKYLSSTQKQKDSYASEKRWITLVNKHLKAENKRYNFGLNLSSHSFRATYITALLRLNSVQNVADIVGHKNIQSTLKYKRYSFTFPEKKEAINKAFKELREKKY